jgi:hypothetical protein
MASGCFVHWCLFNLNFNPRNRTPSLKVAAAIAEPRASIASI